MGAGIGDAPSIPGKEPPTSLPLSQPMASPPSARRTRRPPRPPLARLDIAAIRALEPWLKTPLARAAGALGNVGDQPPLLALSGAVLAAGLIRRDRRLANAGGRMIAAHLLATAAKTIGKDNVDRTRPDELIEDGRHRMEKGGSRSAALRSFPSGHTAGAVAVAAAAARSYRDYRWPLYGAAALIGALQVPRRAHFPTDVAAGALIGLAAESLVAKLECRLGRAI